ncbi:Na+/H+ antiporter NhaA [Glycomyces sp. NPDC047369]
MWANSPWAVSYQAAWGMDITLHIGSFELRHSLKDWINDGLMAVFFFVVGMEIKSELVSGELRQVRNAVAPVAGAIRRHGDSLARRGPGPGGPPGGERRPAGRCSANPVRGVRRRLRASPGWGRRTGRSARSRAPA